MLGTASDKSAGLSSQIGHRLLQLSASINLSQTCIYSLDGRVISWPEGHGLLYGWTSSEMTGCLGHVLLQTRFPKPLEEIRSELLRDGVWQGELLHRTKTGADVWVESWWLLNADSDGPPISITEVNTNITDRKRAEELSKHLAAIVESSDDAIVSIDLRGIVTTWNSAAEKLFGYEALEIIGQSVLTIFPYELLGEEDTFRERLGRGQGISQFETVRVSKTGRRIPVSLTVSPIYNAAGEMVGASKIVRDISQRKALEEALRDAERRTLALEAGELGLWSYDVNLKSLYLSDRAKSIFGLALEAPAPLYADLFDFVHPDDREQVRQAFDLTMSTSCRLDSDFRVVHSSQNRFEHDKHGQRWINIKGRPVTDRDGRVLQINGTLVDFTTRKQMEEALKRTIGQVEQFAFAAAHDLREPLRNVALAVEMARSMLSGKLDDEADGLLSDAVHNARKMEAMVKDLLAYSRVLHQDGEVWPLTDSGVVLKSVLQNLQSSINESSAQVASGEMPVLRMDRTHLLQILQNLIGNALKYRSREAPKIHISAASKQNFWELSVRDNGIGIAPEFHSRVFGMFKRLHDNDVEGSGLGLALCQRIVEHYGGEIRVESDGVHGSTFFFTAPGDRQ